MDIDDLRRAPTPGDDVECVACEKGAVAAIDYYNLTPAREVVLVHYTDLDHVVLLLGSYCYIIYQLTNMYCG